MAPLTYFKNDREPSLAHTLTIDGAVYDLTGASVVLKMRLLGDNALKVNGAVTVVNPPGLDGEVVYNWGATDLDTVGTYLGWFEVTENSKTQTVNEFMLEVREHDQPAGHLCEIADVRLHMGLEDVDRDDETAILDLIGIASDAIGEFTQRELTPTEDATRVITIRQWSPHFVDLAPYDLRSATTVTLAAGSTDEKVLVAGDDYQLSPVGTDPNGVYTAVTLRESLGLGTAFGRYGETGLTILGDWGFSSIPVIAKHATVITVRSWLRRDQNAYAVNPLDDLARDPAPVVAGTFQLPRAAKALLRPIRRVTL